MGLIALNKPLKLIEFEAVQDKTPTYARALKTDLVIVRDDQEISVMYGRCLHRGALLADGHIDGKNLICGLHNWDYRYDTGVSEYNNKEVLYKFNSVVQGEHIYIDEEEVERFEHDNPSPFNEERYLGKYADTHS